jgi:hypothetical protein
MKTTLIFLLGLMLIGCTPTLNKDIQKIVMDAADSEARKSFGCRENWYGRMSYSGSIDYFTSDQSIIVIKERISNPKGYLWDQYAVFGCTDGRKMGDKITCRVLSYFVPAIDDDLLYDKEIHDPLPDYCIGRDQ